MDADATGIAVATLIAVLFLVFYVFARWRERGHDPHWAAEVYLCFDTAASALKAPKIAAAFNSRVASVRQVEIYFAEGGEADGYGFTAGGKVLGGGAAGAPPAGVWLYGAKPRRGTRGVAPFNRAHWFQPS